MMLVLKKKRLITRSKDEKSVCELEMDFSCLATWQDDRRLFVIGRVTSQGVPDDKNSIYRCIVSIKTCEYFLNIPIT